MNETHTILLLVRAGIGLALVPESARTSAPAGIVLQDIELPGDARAELSLFWREDDDNPATARLRLLILDLFR